MSGHAEAYGSGPNAIRAWRPAVPGVSEVFHARFTDHAYPAHTHEDWTVLIVDDGAVRYDLDRREHGALGSMITLLPPQVAHDGRSARRGGFRKRVIYLHPAAIRRRSDRAFGRSSGTGRSAAPAPRGPVACDVGHAG